MEKKLRMTPEQVLEQAKQSVRFAQPVGDIEFSPEDGYRSEVDFLPRDRGGDRRGHHHQRARHRGLRRPRALWQLHQDAARARSQQRQGHLVRALPQRPGHGGGQFAGGREDRRRAPVECTINGLGERAGNCSLEEVVMAVKTRKDYFGLEVGIDTQQIVAASRMVSQTTGFVVQPNKAVVGANAFAHASGIHQDGVLKARDTYEIMRAEDVGWSANKIVLGKLSGRNAFKQRLQELGVQLDSEAEINAAFARFKELADRKSEIFDEDILALVSDEACGESEQYGFVSLAQHSETGERPMHASFHRRWQGSQRRIGRQRPGGRLAQGDRVACQQRRRDGAVFGERHQRLHRKSGRGHGAPAKQRACRQRCGRRP
jgi:2-isopropylmalate synthase